MNGDGFGIGFYCRVTKSKIPRLFKTTSPAWNDPNLREMGSYVASELFFAHVRASSDDSDISYSNCHPFRIGKYLFMHNGGISGFSRIKRELVSGLSDLVYNQLRGSTDSESLFSLLIHNLIGDDATNFDEAYSTDDIANAWIKTLSKVNELQVQSGMPRLKQASSFNVAFTDGETVMVCRYRSVRGNAPSLYYSFGRGFRYNKSTHLFEDTASISPNECRDISNFKVPNPETVIISSEPLNYKPDQWKLIPDGDMLLIHRSKYNNDIENRRVAFLEFRPISEQFTEKSTEIISVARSCSVGR